MATIIQWESGTIADAGGTVQGDVQEWTQGAYRWAAMPGDTSAAERLIWDVSATPSYALRLYAVMPRAWSVTNVDLMRASQSGVQGSAIALPGVGDGGRITFRDAAGTRGQSDVGLLHHGQIARLEVLVDADAQTMRAGVFGLGTDQPIYDTGPQPATVEPAPTRFAAGHFVNTDSLARMAIGSIRVDDDPGSWIGRAPADDGTPSPVTVIGTT